MIKTLITCDGCMQTTYAFDGVVPLAQLYKRARMVEHVPGGALCEECVRRQQKEPSQPAPKHTLRGLPAAKKD